MIKNADVVIIGGGAIGCSTAYRLAERGWKRIALLEKNFLTSGASGRCVGLFRSIWTTEITSRLVLGSLGIIRHLDDELDLNRKTEYRPMAQLMPLYSDEEIVSFGAHIELAQKLGVECAKITPEEARKVCPCLNVNGVQAVVYDLPSTGGALANPFLTTFALAQKAKQMGVKICTQTEVIGLETSRGKISAVLTNRGKINTPVVINATGPYAHSIGRMLGLDHPVGPQRHQIAITEPVELSLDVYIESMATGTYLCQLHNGGVIMGTMNPEGEPIGMNYDSSLDFLMRLSRLVSQLVPALKNARIVRQWAGNIGLSTDGGPILGSVEEFDGYYLALGCGKGFQISFMIGKIMAELLSGVETSLPINELNISRFQTGKLLSGVRQSKEIWQT